MGEEDNVSVKSFSSAGSFYSVTSSATITAEDSMDFNINQGVFSRVVPDTDLAGYPAANNFAGTGYPAWQDTGYPTG